MSHNFAESLAASHAASDLPFWDVVYRKAFPDMLAHHDHRQDGEHQRAGIDRSITLNNSKQILIDEKVRFRNKITGKVYEDIALEYLSDEARNVPGWVCKPLRADFIAYAIAPLGRCYLLPVPQLQAAWVRYGEQWCAAHYIIRAKNERFIRAKNERWITTSVAVPVREVFAAIGQALRVSFDPLEGAE